MVFGRYQITSKKDRADWMKGSCLEKSSNVHFPASSHYFSKDRHDPMNGRYLARLPRVSVTSNLWQLLRGLPFFFSPRKSDGVEYSAVGEQSFCLLILTDNTRCYLKKVAIGLEHNVFISVRPGIYPCALLLSKLALHFC